MAIVYLGLGSNLGHRRTNITRAIAELRRNNVRVIKTAKIIETEPVGGPPQPKFFNTVIQVSTELSPRDLLTTVKAIEKFVGRQRTVKNGPRIIDIDILLYEQQRIRTPKLTIPHPHMFKRNFVLRPLQEIAPDILKKFLHADHSGHPQTS